MLQDYLGKKQFYRFTGPPENWVTAIKYMTWGLERKYYSTWVNITPGDIFLMHSMSTNTRLKDAKSAVIGFGVVGIEGKREKNELLWIEEKEKHINKWPLLVPFSEIYLFNEFHLPQSLPDVTNNNLKEINNLAVQLLSKAVPLSYIPTFPVMGSFSTVQNDIVKRIFDYSNQFFVIASSEEPAETYTPSPLLELEKKEDAFRYGTSLFFLEDVKKKVMNKKESMIIRDNTLLERANDAHQDTLGKLKSLFENKGYKIYFNMHVDLFAINRQRSYLFEVKSHENANFLNQSRKGIVQLFENEYFEIKKFYDEKNFPESPIFKNLAFSKRPEDTNYIRFINSLKLGVTCFKNSELKSIGEIVGIDQI